MKRLAILIGAGALTCFLILLSSDLIGRNERSAVAAADTTVRAAPEAETATPTVAVRQVRVVLPAPFSTEP